MGINKLNYRDAKKLISDIENLEDALLSVKRDSDAQTSKITINIVANDKKNGWPSSYNIPVEQNYRIYECLHELYQSIVDDKYKELNSL
jgi:hypothetical protein